MSDLMNFDEIHAWDSTIHDGHAQVLLQQEREERALEALMHCKQAGSHLADLETLAAEMGLRTAWVKYQQTHHP